MKALKQIRKHLGIYRKKRERIWKHLGISTGKTLAYLELAHTLELHRLAGQVLASAHRIREYVEQHRTAYRHVHAKHNRLADHRLHYEAFKTDAIEFRIVAVVKAQIVMKDERCDCVRRHVKRNSGGAAAVGGDHRTQTRVRKTQPVTEKKRTDER